MLFCDLVDSTRLARQLDPEDLREVVRIYQATSVAVVQRFAGHVAQYLGDGLLIYFGYPQAHEDDAQRAVRTGLGILDAMGSLSGRLARDKSIHLAVRIGIHTGLVVVGEMGSGGRHEHLALGDTPNVAARLQGLAEPNTVVISEATSRLVHGYFTCQPRGAHALKGLETPVHVSEVLGESTALSRLDAADANGLTPLVGREAEVTLLRERWAQSAEGRGQAVVLSGEAGIGKSRLVRVLTEQVVAANTPRLTLRCSQYHTNSALHPVIEHIQRLLHWHRDATPEARIATLEQALQAARLPLADVVPLVATLLSLPVPDRYPPLTLSPPRQKRKTQEALVAWLLAEAAQQPVLAIWEDLHWADPSTLELLGLVLDQVPTARMLLVLTCRPEFQPPWALRSYVTPLGLTRLMRPQVEELVLRVTGEKPLPADVMQQIIAKTDGVPLFVEELTKTLLESGLLRETDGRYALTGPLPPLAIPATLQDALMARLDRLAAVKDVAQFGAILGREFAYEVLRAVAPLDDVSLQSGLAQLVEAELLYQRGIPPQATYIFKHALIRDAAYESLLRSTRQQYHQRIAQALAEHFPETAHTQPELLAHHYTEAGLLAHAVPYWQRAGQRAIERSANIEAVGHLTKGIALLTRLEATPEHRQQELECHIALGTALMVTRGYAAPEVEQTYNRAQELCQRDDEGPALFSALWGVWYFYAVRPDESKAIALATQLLTLAQRAQDSTLLMIAHRALGANLIGQGQLAQGLEQMQKGIALYKPQQHRGLAFIYGQDIGVICRQWSAWALWLLGYPDQALQMTQATLEMAHETSHPLTLAYTTTFSATFHQFRREPARAKALAEGALRLATEQGFDLFAGLAAIVLGEVVDSENSEEGIAQTRAGIAAWRATGAELFVPFHLTQLAEAYGRAGQVEAGLAALDEALAIVERGGEHTWDADLYRVQGELMRQRGAESDAEACLHTALEVARRQGAKSYELRAAVSLSRLWHQQGKREQAHDLLANTYGWFTEGFDTTDLQEAQALLKQLDPDGRLTGRNPEGTAPIR